MTETLERQADQAIYMITGRNADRQLAVELVRPLLPSGARARPASVVHATLVLAGEFNPRTVSRSMQIGALMRGEAFRLVFDTLQCFANGVAVLTCSATPAAFTDIRRQLTQAPRSLGNPVEGGAKPHLTVAYGCRPFEPIRLATPLVWDVTEVELVRSFQGETRHEVLGRWSLS